MKKLRFLYLTAVILMMTGFTEVHGQDFAPNCKKSEIAKRAKKRAKGMKKQGYVPDINLGTPYEQFQKRIQYECMTFSPAQGAKQKYPRYTFENFTATATSEANAITKSRDGARRQLGANAGNTFRGLIETEGVFVNGNEEDLSNEIEQAFEAFDEIFDAELNKNILITRFHRRENNGNYTCNVSIALDNLQLANDIKALKKEELQKRIDRTRKKKENLFGN